MKLDADGEAALSHGGRPPRGGRGLKFGTVDHLLEGDEVAPLAGGVD